MEEFFLECGAFPPLFFLSGFNKQQAKQSGGKAPHSKKSKSPSLRKSNAMALDMLGEQMLSFISHVDWATT